MELAYLWIREKQTHLPLTARKRPTLYLIHPDERDHLCGLLEPLYPRFRVVRSGTLSFDGEKDGCQNEYQCKRLKRLLAKSSGLVLSSKPFSNLRLAELICQAFVKGVRVTNLETALLELLPSVPAEIDKLVALFSHDAVIKDFRLRTYTTLKYLLEPLVAGLLLALLSPILLLTALAVRLTSPGPVLYRQERLGLGEKPFDLLKFRSMRIDAEKNGPVWASASRTDSRTTCIGGFLRAAHLDELPQLWNVVRGELSFIGPRPERRVFVDALSREIPLFRLRTLVRPGITGWAQVNQGYANTTDDARRKLEFDFFYILKHCPLLDAMIVLKTLKVLLTGGTEGKKRELLARGAIAPTLLRRQRRPALSSVRVSDPVLSEQSSNSAREISA